VHNVKIVIPPPRVGMSGIHDPVSCQTKALVWCAEKQQCKTITDFHSTFILEELNFWCINRLFLFQIYFQEQLCYPINLRIILAVPIKPFKIVIV
jgi:hypothetical protein